MIMPETTVNYCCLHHFKYNLTERLCQNLIWCDTFDYVLYKHVVSFNEAVSSNTKMPSDFLILFRATLEIFFPFQ